MKIIEKNRAIQLRESGLSINHIAKLLGVSKSSVSVWVRNTELSVSQSNKLAKSSHSSAAIEKRRKSRLYNENEKRKLILTVAKNEIGKVTNRELWLAGTMMYWAEGGKTQRLVRFSNGDPEMIKMIMRFFREICNVPESKFRGYIHIHPHLDSKAAELYWSSMANIPLTQFFKTYSKVNKGSKNKKDTLPYGVLDVYVMDSTLFLKIVGWAHGIFGSKITRNY